MPSIADSTKEKIRNYVRECAAPGMNWEYNAESICHLIEHGKIIGEKDIMYAENGTISKIKGTQVVDGVVLLKEKKKPLKAIAIRNEEINPLIEEIRAKRKVVTL